MLTSLLETYKLEYIISFPTTVTNQSSSAIDNIFLDSSKYDKYTIVPHYNGLFDHDALMVTVYLYSHKASKSTNGRFGRNYCMENINKFKLGLSFETWENVFEVARSTDIDTAFNSFLKIGRAHV